MTPLGGLRARLRAFRMGLPSRAYKPVRRFHEAVWGYHGRGYGPSWSFDTAGCGQGTNYTEGSYSWRTYRGPVGYDFGCCTAHGPDRQILMIRAGRRRLGRGL